MAKKKELDLMKFLPVAIVAVSVIGSYFTLSNRVGNAEDKLDKMENIQSVLSRDSAEIRVSQVRSEEKINSIFELLKDIKNKNGN